MAAHQRDATQPTIQRKEGKLSSLTLCKDSDLAKSHWLINNQMYLSKGHSEGLWDTREGLGLGVVLQENAIALKNHIWLTVNHQRALKRFKAHCVGKLSTVGRHLVATWWKRKLNSSKRNSGKIIDPYDTAGEVSYETPMLGLILNSNQRFTGGWLCPGFLTSQHVEARLNGNKCREIYLHCFSSFLSSRACSLLCCFFFLTLSPLKLSGRTQ